MTVRLISQRFTTEEGVRISVQLPAAEVARVMAQVQSVDPLIWGDYDQVGWTTAEGVQQFRALGTGRNAATPGVVDVPCAEVTFFVAGTQAHLARVIEAIYAGHPYEEPVIFVQPVIRCCHVPGMDEENPNRFWNRATPDWVPDAHR